MSARVLRTIIIAAAALGAAFATGAAAQGRVEAGLLTCGVKSGASFIFGSTRELRCVFRTSPGDEGDRYEGSIQKYGLDIGFTGHAILEWTVLAPSRGLPFGALSGRYYGVSADASVGIGGGANVLARRIGQYHIAAAAERSGADRLECRGRRRRGRAAPL